MPQSSGENSSRNNSYLVQFLRLCLLGIAVYLIVFSVQKIKTVTENAESLGEATTSDLSTVSASHLPVISPSPSSWLLVTQYPLTLVGGSYAYNQPTLTPTSIGSQTAPATPGRTSTPETIFEANTLAHRAASSSATTHTASSVTLAAATSNNHIIRLSSPTPIVFANPDYDVTRNESFVVLDWNITLYTQSENQFTVSTNGIFSIGGQTAAGLPEIYESYTDNYPIEDLYTYELVPGTACVWWEELIIPANSTKGIFYQIDGREGGQTLSVEYVLNDAQDLLYRFIVEYNEIDTGIITFYYFTNGDSGHNTTVGVQGLNSTEGPEYIQYEAAGSDFLYTGLVLIFDTIGGGYLTDYFNVNCFPPASWPIGIGGPGCPSY